MNDDEILTAAKISDAMAHPVRIRMLRYILTENLARRNVTNKDLVKAFDYAQATISQHISKLMIGGLLEMQKKGTSSCYFARVGKLLSYTEIIKKIEPKGDQGELPGFLRNQLFAPDHADGELGELEEASDQDGFNELEDLADGFQPDVLEGQLQFSPEEPHYL